LVKCPLVKRRLVKKPITTFGKMPFGIAIFGKHDVWYSNFWLNDFPTL
jgi:hypothetical protein